MGIPLTDGERRLLSHITLWGNDGYPVARRGRRWFLETEGYGIKHPGSWPTKREAIAAFEALRDALGDRYAEESMRRAGASEEHIERAMAGRAAEHLRDRS